jgi:hypothetical protein
VTDHLSAAHDSTERARRATGGDTQNQLDAILKELEKLSESGGFGTDEHEDDVHELEQKLSGLMRENSLDAEAREHINEAAISLRQHRQSVK